MDEEVQAARKGHSAGGSQPPQLMPSHRAASAAQVWSEDACR